MPLRFSCNSWLPSKHIPIPILKFFWSFFKHFTWLLILFLRHRCESIVSERKRGCRRAGGCAHPFHTALFALSGCCYTFIRRCLIYCWWKIFHSIHANGACTCTLYYNMLRGYNAHAHKHTCIRLPQMQTAFLIFTSVMKWIWSTYVNGTTNR